MTEYRIRRTSTKMYHGSIPPCKGAYTKPKEEWNLEHCEDYHELDEDSFWCPWWIEIETMGDLWYLISKVGRIVLFSSGDDWQTGIEIYDVYRE